MMLALIPLGIIAATLAIPKQHKNAVLQPSPSAALPLLIKTIEKENYTIILRGNSQTPGQLEWINKTVLTFPTAVIYKTAPGKNDIANAELIGRIEARGTYHFDLKNDSTKNYHFILYDFIHQKIIDSINF
ncbi:MAG: hypothetical protein ABIN97_16065 [Ginsengibacter sp.]